MGWFDEFVDNTRNELGKIGDKIGVTGNAMLDLPALMFRGLAPKDEPSAGTAPAPIDPANDPATIKKQEEEMLKVGKRRGRAATLLTGGQGLMTEQPKTARRMLLGE